MGTSYRCEATTAAGFVQQLAVAYISHGYRYYVVLRIPLRKKPRVIDEKLIEFYGLDVSKFQRARRKRAGHANAQYIRFERFAVLLATPPPGGHRLFLECPGYIDIRKRAIRFDGYSIGASYSTYTGRWHASVRIAREEFFLLRDYMLTVATRFDAEELMRCFRSMRFEPYARVARQYLSIWKQVNELRSAAGLQQLPRNCLRLRRTSTSPFCSVPLPTQTGSLS